MNLSFFLSFFLFLSLPRGRKVSREFPRDDDLSQIPRTCNNEEMPPRFCATLAKDSVVLATSRYREAIEHDKFTSLADRGYMRRDAKSAKFERVFDHSPFISWEGNFERAQVSVYRFGFSSAASQLRLFSYLWEGRRVRKSQFFQRNYGNSNPLLETDRNDVSTVIKTSFVQTLKQTREERSTRISKSHG